MPQLNLAAEIISSLAPLTCYSTTPQETLERGARLDAMTRLSGIPGFQPRGIFRGTQAFFDAMDAEKERKRQAWFEEHAKLMASK